MDTINQFRKTLLENGKSASKVTVKNYFADVKKFVLWYEKTYQRPFPPSVITPEAIEAYLRQCTELSPRSAKRYRSSLNKFFTFLLMKKQIPFNPLSAVLQEKKDEDVWHLKEFNNFLYSAKASKVTMKNYVNDVTQFLLWAKELNQNNDVLARINSTLIEEYKERLLTEAGLSPVSVNRKLSSLRKYIGWATGKGYLKQPTEVAESIPLAKQPSFAAPQPPPAPVSPELAVDALQLLNVPDPTSDPTLADWEAEVAKSYSRFAPLRLYQKSKKGVNVLFDTLVILSVLKTIEAVKYNFWKRTSKEVFAPLPTVFKTLTQAEAEVTAEIAKQPISALERFIKAGQKATGIRVRSIPKAQYAPHKISTQALPFPQRIRFYIRHVRPAWYKKYHSYAFVHYIHFGVVLIFAVILGHRLYVTFYGPGFQQNALASTRLSPNRLISFQGRLSDATGTPITKDSLIRFSIYKSRTASGSALLWQETQHLDPDSQGNFQTTLGKSNPISQDFFVQHPELFLGISVGSDPELTPRHPLASMSLARNAEQLQGLKPITENNSITANVILALDSSGNLTIGGSASPVFQATGGEFTLSGQQLTLATNPGTNTNIQLIPDGTGIIDLQKPLQNTSENNNLTSALGAVEVDDTFAILATSSAQSAFTIRQNSTGELISASTGDTAKFTVANNGSGMFAGDLRVLGNNFTTGTNVFNLANDTTTILNIGGAATQIAIGAPTGTTTVNNALSAGGVITANGGITLPSGKNFTLSGFLAGSIPFINSSNQLTQDNLNFYWDVANSRLGLGTNAPSSKLSVVDDVTGAGAAAARITNPNTIDSKDTTALRVNLGTAATGTKGRFISFYAGCTTEGCAGTNVGSIRINNNSVSFESTGADFAERFSVHEATEPGDIIGASASQNRKARGGDTILGVVSDSAVVVGNSPDKVDEAKNPIVGLLGQVKTKVSAANGAIKKGDLITISDISGVGMKATQPGPVLGTALEDLPAGIGQSKILVLIRPGWHQPQTVLMDNGSLVAAFETRMQREAHESNALNDFVATLKAGVIEATTITTTSLSVTTDNIMIGSQTLRAYIAGIVNEILDERFAENEKTKIVVVSPVAEAEVTPASASAGTELTPSPYPLTPTPVASQSATYITNIYNNISSSSAILTPSSTPTPTVEQSPAASPSGEPSPTPSVLPELIDEADASESATPNITDYSLIQMLRKQVRETKAAKIASFSAELAYVPNLKADIGTFEQGLIALGPVSLAETSISTQLSIGQSMTLSENSINNLAGDLHLQPLRQGNLAIMGGLVAIDTSGNLNVEGNANFAKDVTVRGALATNIIKPVPDSDLAIQVHGDVAGSGSARFAEEIEAKQGKFADLRIIRGAQADTSFTQTTASGSAGTAVIAASETERTIITPHVHENSLIYITPVSDTQGVSPYIARQTVHNQITGSRGSFTIQLPRSVARDIKLNWWIIN